MKFFEAKDGGLIGVEGIVFDPGDFGVRVVPVYLTEDELDDLNGMLADSTSELRQGTWNKIKDAEDLLKQDET
jgi:hypothetical protein